MPKLFTIHNPRPRAATLPLCSRIDRFPGASGLPLAALRVSHAAARCTRGATHDYGSVSLTDKYSNQG